MSTKGSHMTRAYFRAPVERRYESHPRRYLNEYFWDSRRHHADPNAKGSCATYASAKAHATKAIDVFGATTVRIFDRMTGQYKRTYKAGKDGILIHEGFVR